MTKRSAPVRALTLLLALCCLLGLSSCGSEAAAPSPKSCDITVDGQTMTVSFAENDLSSGTITADSGEYRFAYTRQGELEILYPDGSRYTLGDGFGAASIDHDPERHGYVSGLSLGWALEDTMDEVSGRRESRGPSPLLMLLLLGLGAWFLLAPRSAWWLARGWWYKNAEPSEAGLMVYRLGGILLGLVGIIGLLAGR